MSSSSRILASLNDENIPNLGKAATHPTTKTTSKAANPLSKIDNVSKRRTVDAYNPNNLETTPLFSKPQTSSGKQMSMTNFVNLGKQHSSIKKNNVPLHDKKGKENKLAIHCDKTKNSQQKQDDLDLICDKEISEKYWELLAEERRKALVSALKQNKELADEIRAKDKTIKELQEELEDLQEFFKEAENVTSVLQNMFGEEESLQEKHVDTNARPVGQEDGPDVDPALCKTETVENTVKKQDNLSNKLHEETHTSNSSSDSDEVENKKQL